MLAIKEALVVLVVLIIEQSVEQTTNIASTKYERVYVGSSSFSSIKATTFNRSMTVNLKSKMHFCTYWMEMLYLPQSNNTCLNCLGTYFLSLNVALRVKKVLANVLPRAI